MESIATLKGLMEEDEIIRIQMTIVEFDKSSCVNVSFVPDTGHGLRPVHGLLPSAYFKAFVTEYIKGSILPPFDPSSTNVEKSVAPEPEVSSMADESHIPIEVPLHEGETERQRRYRLGRWKSKPTDPNMSYGVRLREKDAIEEMEKLKLLSKGEYEETYGIEDREVEHAMRDSLRSYQNEKTDERLIDLRKRAPVEEREQIRQWQVAAEESLKLEVLHQMTEEQLLQKGIEESLRPIEDDMDKALRESQETYAVEKLAQ